LLRRLLTLACLLTGLLVSGPVVAQSPAAQQGESKQASQPAHAKSTLEMGNGDFFAKQFEHSVPYPIMGYEKGPDGKPKVGLLTVYNVQPWQWISLGLILVLFLPVVRSFGGGRVSWFHRILRGWCLWIRDEMVYKVMGKEHGRPFVPFFLFVFFFICFQNVLGLIPSAGHHFPLAIYTATGTPYVTGALAIVIFLTMIGMGMKQNGVLGFWKGLVPHVPLLLWPMMFAIELVGLVVKPFALTIRLFANMLAGHLVIGSAIALVFLFTKMQGGAATSYLTALPCAGLAIFIYVIEAFVTLLQAYIFTFLSINFLWQAMHQEH
jgi:F-type H+-transporting ATPase subunit a